MTPGRNRLGLPAGYPRAGLELAGLAIGFAGLYAFHFLPRSGLYSATQLFLIGSLLILGVFAGSLAQRLRLPKITGYLLVGALASPSLPSLFPSLPLPTLVDPTQAKTLKLVNDVAIGLIALMAGAEIRLDWLRARWRAILAIAALELVLVPPFIAMLVAHDGALPGLAPFPFMQAAWNAGIPTWGAAALAAAIILANSPTVVVSVLKETGSKGPLSHTVMGVSVVMDAVVIFAFTVIVAIIGAATSPTGLEEGVVTAAGAGVLLSILVSVAIGLVIGWGLQRYTERTDHRLGWALVGLAVAAAVLGPIIHLEPLFCLLAVGFACENLPRRTAPEGTRRLEAALARVGVPVFVIFFVVAGLNLDLVSLVHFWELVVVLSLARLMAVFLAVRIGARAAGAEGAVSRYGWIGMVSQAGVTLALAQLAASRFPGWGDTLATFIVAMVALHELLAPAAFAWSLQRAGEATVGPAARLKPTPPTPAGA